MSTPPRRITKAKLHNLWLSPKDTMELQNRNGTTPILIPPTAVARHPFRHLLETATSVGPRWTSHVMILAPTLQTPITCLHSYQQTIIGVKWYWTPRIPTPSPPMATSQLSRPQTPFLGPLKSEYPPKNTSIHPRTTRAILSFAVDRLFIISLICLSTLLLHILSSSPDIFSFCTYLSGLV